MPALGKRIQNVADESSTPVADRPDIAGEIHADSLQKRQKFNG